MSQEELEVMDFGPDLELLDDLLGVDWYKLEPTLELVDPNSPHSPLGPELPMLPMVATLQPLTPEPVQVPSPQNSSLIYAQLSPSPPTPPQVVPQPMETNLTSIKMNPTIHNIPNPNHHTPLTQQHQVLTTNGTPFTGFGIPFTSAMFANGNTVLLPQLQLAVVDNQQSQSGKRNNKLPVKRLEKDTTSHGGRKKESTRRSSHNAIERRYRSSINDKILELKNLVCAPTDPNEKVHKAAILRSSIDTIRYLQNSNSRLDKENRDLKKSISQCPNCRNDMTLRGILSASSPATPPPTESESTDSSNPPSPNEDIKHGTKKAFINKSPLVLFSIVTGLFLINPITNNTPINTGEGHHHPHSRVERSADSYSIDTNDDFYGLRVWYPRILTIFVNLLIFIFLYYMTGKISNNDGWRKKYTQEKLKRLRNKNWTQTNSNSSKADEIAGILSEFDTVPKNWFTKYLGILINLGMMPFQLRRKTTNIKYTEINEEISTLYLEYGKACGGNNGIYPYIRAINFSPLNKQILIRSLILAKSKLLLKYVLLWTDFSEHATFGTPEGILFLKNWITKELPAEFILSGTLPGSDHHETSQMVTKFREETLAIGISQLFYFGTGSDLFRTVLKSCTKSDKYAQFWSCIFWAEAEWIRGGGRTETLKRLCRLIDDIWKVLKEKEENFVISKAVYKVHLSKRAMMMDHVPCKETLDLASAYLRDSINLTKDKPKQVIQLIWCLAAEWILECRLELWEETKEVRGFSKDLDTLRSLTHYSPAVLPSVYLYEACQRLMNYAAPGRTQQLLDASLRQVRTNQRALICNSYSDELSALAAASADAAALGNPTHCKLGKRNAGVNLVREKRKAFALYLKCKYLPNQVITCPGEKAGMLKEALKALERIGEKKKINECLEMIRTLGQSITLH